MYPNLNALFSTHRAYKIQQKSEATKRREYIDHDANLKWRPLGTRHLEYLDAEDKFSSLFTQVRENWLG